MLRLQHVVCCYSCNNSVFSCQYQDYNYIPLSIPHHLCSCIYSCKWNTLVYWYSTNKHRKHTINSFIMVKCISDGNIYECRLSNRPTESLNGNTKDLERSGREYLRFDYLKNRLLFLTRIDTTLHGVSQSIIRRNLTIWLFTF